MIRSGLKKICLSLGIGLVPIHALTATDPLDFLGPLRQGGSAAQGFFAGLEISPGLSAVIETLKELRSHSLSLSEAQRRLADHDVLLWEIPDDEKSDWFTPSENVHLPGSEIPLRFGLQVREDMMQDFISALLRNQPFHAFLVTNQIFLMRVKTATGNTLHFTPVVLNAFDGVTLANDTFESRAPHLLPEDVRKAYAELDWAYRDGSGGRILVELEQAITLKVHRHFRPDPIYRPDFTTTELESLLITKFESLGFKNIRQVLNLDEGPWVDNYKYRYDWYYLLLLAMGYQLSPHAKSEFYYLPGNGPTFDLYMLARLEVGFYLNKNGEDARRAEIERHASSIKSIWEKRAAILKLLGDKNLSLEGIGAGGKNDNFAQRIGHAEKFLRHTYPGELEKTLQEAREKHWDFRPDCGKDLLQ